MISEDILASTNQTNQSIIYDVVSSKCIVDVAIKHNAKAIKSRVGHRFIKELFRQYNAAFAGEMSGHLFFKDVGGFEFPMLALYHIMHLADQYPDFAAMVHSVQKYTKKPQENFHIADKEQTIQDIKTAFAHYTQEEIDGVSIFGEDFRCNIRMSNTEPILRLNIEADTQARRDEVYKQIVQYIK